MSIKGDVSDLQIERMSYELNSAQKVDLCSEKKHSWVFLSFELITAS